MSQNLRINEIFFSIQGESSRMGLPCIFVRLAGCHLRCTYCDTAYAFHEGGTMSVGAIVERVASYPCTLVEITGGEPLLQKGVFALMRRLCDAGNTVLLETSGACDIDGWDGADECDDRVIRIMDLKTPGSGECHRNDWSNIARLRSTDEVKFVICDRLDYEWAHTIIEEYDLTERVGSVLMSAVFEQAPGTDISGKPGLAMRELAEWILADGLRVRMQAQLHKFIWEPSTRGV